MCYTLAPPASRSRQNLSKSNLPDVMVDSKEMLGDDMSVIIQYDKQVERFQQLISLAEKFKPQLRAYGANFNLWSKNMILAWTPYFMGDPDYFQETSVNTNIKQNLVASLFIEHSVNNSANESVMPQILSLNACQIYQAPKDPFNCPLWSSVIYHANILFKPSLDHSSNINEYAISVTKVV
ncbi:hypothetical protein O181_082382 [Austropuccinia psidii MF-1]|uniref:Uncharacterized protein n=1 Tax=Austropuccinia psidii MF-1 TaxID=1389203 RepID=A0A9Q3IJ63_9BASI|nr:hypothetical protein [Austropuccinia psidii MF-1]